MTKPCGQMNSPIRTAAYPSKEAGFTAKRRESVNQTPDLGARRGVWEHEKAYSGREAGKKRTQGGNKRTYSQTVFNPDPGSQRENRGLEREKAYSGRAGGKKRSLKARPPPISALEGGVWNLRNHQKVHQDVEHCRSACDETRISGCMPRTAEERKCLGLKCWRENWHCHSDGGADRGRVLVDGCGGTVLVPLPVSRHPQTTQGARETNPARIGGPSRIKLPNKTPGKTPPDSTEGRGYRGLLCFSDPPAQDRSPSTSENGYRERG